MRPTCHICLSLLLACKPFVCALPCANSNQVVAPPSTTAGVDPALDDTVSASLTDAPLGTALQTVSRKLTVSLEAAHSVENQRVTLDIRHAPVRMLMDRLSRLLSHAASEPRGYHSAKSQLSTGSRVTYRLVRDEVSYREERDALDFPTKKAEQQLRDFRHILQLTPEQRQ